MAHTSHHHASTQEVHGHHHPPPDASPEEGHAHGGSHDHHAHMVQDFQRRFWISLILTLPVLVLSPSLQEWLGFSLSFPGHRYVLWLLSSVVFFYGGWPFLKGAWDELRAMNPGMMTLIGLAISVAYGYSSLVVWGVPGRMFFWELVTGRPV